MKKIFWGILGLTAAAGAASRVQDQMGVGFVLGNPSGLSAKIPSGSANSINFILGYSLNRDYGWGNDRCCRDGGTLYLGGDYVWYNYGLFKVSQGKLPLYYGPGLWAAIGDHSSVGVRAVVGLEYRFVNAPFDIFLEIGPGIQIVPNTNGDVSAGLGTRFFF